MNGQKVDGTGETSKRSKRKTARGAVNFSDKSLKCQIPCGEAHLLMKRWPAFPLT